MAPRDMKAQRVNAQKETTKKPAVSVVTSKTMSTRTIEETPIKGAKTTKCEHGTNPVATPKPKQNNPVTVPGNLTRSVKKSWKRRPKPAHSGVPVPEKMKRLLQQQLQNSDCSF